MAEQRDHIDHLAAQVRRERPDLDVGTIELIGRIARLQHHINDTITTSTAPYGLRVGELSLLITLRRSGAPYRLTPTELYRAMMVSSAGATRRIDALERRGFVRRTPDPGDRRGTLIELTPAGLRTVDAAWPAHLDQTARLFDGLAAADRRTLNDLLRQVLLHVESP